MLLPRLLFVLSLVFLAVHATPSHWSPEIYRSCKVIDLNPAGCPSNENVGGRLAYDKDTETVWLTHGKAHNVVVLDPNDYNIKVVLPYVDLGKDIVFTDELAAVTDYGTDTIRIYDKSSYVVVQLLNVPGGPDAVYWNPVSGSLWVALQDTSRVVEFAANSRWEPERFNPVAISNLSLSLPPSTEDNAGPGYGVLVNGRLYQPIRNVIDVIDVHWKYIIYSISFPFEGKVQSLSYDVRTGNILVSTDTNVAFLVSTFDGSIITTIPLDGPASQTAVLASIRRGYIANLQGQVDVINLDTRLLLPSTFNTTVNTGGISAIEYPDSTEVWTYLEQQNKVSVYEWSHHS